MSEQLFDLLIRGGTVVDGSGAAGLQADVGVRGERIAAIGTLDGRAQRVIDATGLVIAPGFIDVHAHDDAAVLTSPMDFKLMQGVTTDIVGNCGAGVAPTRADGSVGMPGVEIVLGPLPEATWHTFGEYMDAVDAAHPALNVACLVPHGAVRAKNIGLDARPADEDELRAMREDVAEGMAAGAVGLSTGLIYPPGSFAGTDEIVELARVAAQHGGAYVSHIRNEGDHLMEAVQEAVTIGREAGLPVQISHHKAGSPAVWGKTRDSIAYIEEQRSRGLDITFDVYPYTAASTVLSAFARAAEGIDPDSVIVASVEKKREYEGKTLTQIAQMLGVAPQDAASRVLQDEPAAVAVFFLMHEDDVRRVLSHPLCMIGSDGLPSPTGKPHPRLYGTFPRVLGTYVREESLLTLEEAVRKMSGLPSQRFGLAGRGALRKGWFADIVVFDPQTVADVATYEEPRQYPAGIEYVIVNGQIAAERGRQTAARAGRLLRRNNAA